MAGEIYHDPASGRPYRVNPATGRSEWIDDAPPQAAWASAQPQLTPQPVRPAQFTYPTHHEPQGTKKHRVSGWVWGVGGLVIGFVVGAGTGGGGDTTATTAAVGSESVASVTGKASPPEKSKPAKTQIAEAVVVIKDPRTFGDAFDANQVAAEKEWNGKRVQLTAEVQNITDGRVSFTGVTTKEFSLTQVACKLSDPEQALTVKNGKKATAVGTVDGQFMGVIELEECVLK